MVTALTGACDRERADVLREFPPPRLAREVPRASPSPQMAPADCVATWRLHGRTSRTSYQLPATGQFQLLGDPARPATGEVKIHTADANPQLPERVARALRSRDASGEWTWRLLSALSRASTFDGVQDEINTPEGPATSELELNAVRTRQSHVVSVNSTRDRDDAITVETTLRIELSAHRVTGILLADESAPRRADLLIRCELSTSNDSE